MKSQCRAELGTVVFCAASVAKNKPGLDIDSSQERLGVLRVDDSARILSCNNRNPVDDTDYYISSDRPPPFPSPACLHFE